MLVGPGDGRVDGDDPFRVSDGVVFSDRRLQDLAPGAVHHPTAQPFAGGLKALAFGQVPLPSAGAQLLRDRADHLPVITPPPPAGISR